MVENTPGVSKKQRLQEALSGQNPEYIQVVSSIRDRQLSHDFAWLRAQGLLKHVLGEYYVPEEPRKPLSDLLVEQRLAEQGHSEKSPKSPYRVNVLRPLFAACRQSYLMGNPDRATEDFKTAKRKYLGPIDDEVEFMIHREAAGIFEDLFTW